MRFNLMVLILVICLTISSCNLPIATDCARPEIFCVGLVTAFGTVDDHGLNQSAWEGVQQAHNEGLIHKADFIETIDARDRAKNIRTFLEADYDLIVTVGISMEEDTRLAADEWPGAAFIGVNQPSGESRPNLATITFPEDQGGFLAGALAALVTNTGKVAALCEVESLPSMWRYCEGFRVGVRYANPDLRARVLYKDESATSELFKDPKWGEEQALFMLDGGVDILFSAGGETARAALETAAAHGVYVIGAEEDMYYQLENVDFVLSSVVKQAGASVYALIRLAIEGQFAAGERRGAYALGPWHSLERQVPPTVQERLEQIRIGLTDGSIQTGVPNEH
jgi:basic membrane protein A and related proteins